jgi:anti-anti-sigma factor
MATITHEDISEDLRRIVIDGAPRHAGTNEIAPKLKELSASPHRGFIVDLSGVEFAASIAIGQFIVNAREAKNRGGHMVLVANPHSAVMMSLTTTGIDRVIPVFPNQTEAYVGALRGF